MINHELLESWAKHELAEEINRLNKLLSQRGRSPKVFTETDIESIDVFVEINDDSGQPQLNISGTIAGDQRRFSLEYDPDLLWLASSIDEYSASTASTTN